MAESLIVMLVLSVLATIVLILWIFLPFAIFGTKPKLDELIREQRAANALLAQIAERLASRP